MIPLLPPPLFLTVPEAARRLEISPRTLQREIFHGLFPKPSKIGRSVRIPVVVFEDYVRSLLAPGARDPFVKFSGGDHLDHQMLVLIVRLTRDALLQNPS